MIKERIKPKMSRQNDLAQKITVKDSNKVSLAMKRQAKGLLEKTINPISKNHNNFIQRNLSFKNNRNSKS